MVPHIKAGDSVYLGLLILFGLSPSAQTRDYWSSDPFLGNNYVKKIMTEKRFEKIMQYFHCSDNPNLTATAWKDTGKTPVGFISSFSKPDVVTHCVRRIGQTLTRVRIPSIAHTYNHGYNFVDLFDLYRSKYKVGHNCKKSWKYIFYFLIDATIVNSYILYSQSSTCTTNVKRYDQF